MMYKSKVSGKASSIPAGIAAGVSFSMVLTLMLGALLAVLIHRETIPQEKMGYWIMAILFIASAVGSSMAYRKIQHRRMLIYFLTAGMYIMCLCAITGLFFGGKFEGVLPTAVLILGGAGMAFLFPGVGKSSSSKVRYPGRIW